MRQQISITKSASTTELSGLVHPHALMRPQTPGLEERFSYSFKSLFTLADVAARRRASGGFKKRANKTDENDPAREAVGRAFLRRSKSNGDVAVLGASDLNVNAEYETGANGAPSRFGRGNRARRAATSHSKLSKAKPVAWLQNVNGSLQHGHSGLKVASSTSLEFSNAEQLNVDDAVFVLVTPAPSDTKVLTLAAHTPSLPRIASPLSPRITQPCASQQPRSRSITPRSTPRTGHTAASLHLTKSHWEFRYERWTRSLRISLPHTAEEISRLAPTRSRFHPPLTNPALFPRAGSLTSMALRPVTEETISGEDVRPALEVDWALRAWPLDKIQRALFVHDMSVRICFSVGGKKETYDVQDALGQKERVEVELRGGALEHSEEDGRLETGRWEWDWELRWRVIEGMADHEPEGAEREYDAFLAEEDTEGDRAYAGCEMQERFSTEKVADAVWTDDAMEVDAIL